MYPQLKGKTKPEASVDPMLLPGLRPILARNLVLADCTSNRSRLDVRLQILTTLGSFDCDRAGNKSVDQFGTAHHPLEANGSHLTRVINHSSTATRRFLDQDSLLVKYANNVFFNAYR